MAMHEENILNSWLREDTEGKVEEKESFVVEPNKRKIRLGKDRLKEKRKRLSLTEAKNPFGKSDSTGCE